MQRFIWNDQLISNHWIREDVQKINDDILMEPNESLWYKIYQAKFIQQDSRMQLKILKNLYENFSNYESVIKCFEFSEFPIILEQIILYKNENFEIAIQIYEKVIRVNKYQKLLMWENVLSQIISNYMDQTTAIQNTILNIFLQLSEHSEHQELLFQQNILDFLQQCLSQESNEKTIIKILQIIILFLNNKKYRKYLRSIGFDLIIINLTIQKNQKEVQINILNCLCYFLLDIKYQQEIVQKQLFQFLIQNYQGLEFNKIYDKSSLDFQIHQAILNNLIATTISEQNILEFITQNYQDIILNNFMSFQQIDQEIKGLYFNLFLNLIKKTDFLKEINKYLQQHENYPQAKNFLQELKALYQNPNPLLQQIKYIQQKQNPLRIKKL